MKKKVVVNILDGLSCDDLDCALDLCVAPSAVRYVRWRATTHVRHLD